MTKKKKQAVNKSFTIHNSHLSLKHEKYTKGRSNTAKEDKSTNE
jgi:hypothetical protein